MTKPDTIIWCVRVVGPDFVAAFETKVRVTVPILRKYIHGLSTDEARAINAEEGWQATVDKKQLTEPCVIQHRESFEVQKDGVKAFFLYDDVATSRRALNGRCDKQAALIKAQACLAGA